MKWDDSKYQGMTDNIFKAFCAVHDRLEPGFHFAKGKLEFKRFDNFNEIERRGLRLE